MNVLVIEDDRRIAHVLRAGLSEEGHRVHLSYLGDEGAELIQSQHFDVVILDAMLPVLDGFAILKRTRTANIDVPILMLTARDAMADVVRGLDLGADDYLTKPFQLEVLLARVRAVGRRKQGSARSELVAGDLVLDQSQRLAWKGGRELALTRKEFILLDLLMRRAGQVVTRDQMIEAGWGYAADVRDNTIDFYISSLRSKIDHKPGITKDGKSGSSLIRTVRALGYALTIAE